MGNCCSCLEETIDLSTLIPEQHNIPSIHSLFTFNASLGSGSYGTVMSATAKTQLGTVISPNQTVAIKLMKKSQTINAKCFYTEVKTLSNLTHPNIVRFLTAFIDDTHYCIITELLTGSELFDRIVSLKRYDEAVACNLFKQLLSAVKYMHKRNIAHLDIKPENIIFAASDTDTLRLIDFGCAIHTDSTADVIYFNQCGTPFYSSPDNLKHVVRRSMTDLKTDDMWSLGVVLFTILTGCIPFSAPDYYTLKARVCSGVYRFPVDMAPSPLAQDLIKKLLVVDIDKRLTVEEALQHPWVRGGGSSHKLTREVRVALEHLNTQSKFRKAIAQLLLDRMSAADRSVLDRIYAHLDKDQRGYIDPRELVGMLRHSPDPTSERMLQAMNASETMNMDDIATLHLEGRLITDSPCIREIFSGIDSDGDGLLTEEDVKAVLVSYPQDVVSGLFAEIDKDGDGWISFGDFTEAIRGEGVDIALSEVGTPLSMSHMSSIGSFQKHVGLPVPELDFQGENRSLFGDIQTPLLTRRSI